MTQINRLADYPDELLGRNLAHQIENAIAAYDLGLPHYRVYVCAADNATVKSRHVGNTWVPNDYDDLGRRACIALNRECRLDGAHVVVWAGKSKQKIKGDFGGETFVEVPSTMLILWKDRDGDVPYSRCIDFDHRVKVDQIKLAQIDDRWVLGHALEAHAVYMNQQRGIEVRPDQTIKRAQGQLSVEQTRAN